MGDEEDPLAELPRHSLGDSGEERLRLTADLRKYQYRVEATQSQEWAIWSLGGKFYRQNAALGATRNDLSRGITHMVDLDRANSPRPRAGYSKGREPSSHPVKLSKKRSSSRANKMGYRARVGSPPAT